jgi:elongation factor G
MKLQDRLLFLVWESLHLDIIVDRLRREFKVEVNQGQPQVEYKEAITSSADHREVYKKQTGGRGKFADIVFTMEPAEEGKSGLEFVNVIKGGNIPKEYIPSVEKGFREAMKNGPLAGFEMDSMKITLRMVRSTLWIQIHYRSSLPLK